MDAHSISCVVWIRLRNKSLCGHVMYFKGYILGPMSQCTKNITCNSNNMLDLLGNSVKVIMVRSWSCHWVILGTIIIIPKTICNNKQDTSNKQRIMFTMPQNIFHAYSFTGVPWHKMFTNGALQTIHNLNAIVNVCKNNIGLHWSSPIEVPLPLQLPKSWQVLQVVFSRENWSHGGPHHLLTLKP